MESTKRRRALTDANRLSIRKRNREHAPGQQQEFINWLTATTGHPINQGQISKILSDKYDYLDGIYTRKDR
jgi:hypothetical protein